MNDQLRMNNDELGDGEAGAGVEGTKETLKAGSGGKTGMCDVCGEAVGNKINKVLFDGFVDKETKYFVCIKCRYTYYMKIQHKLLPDLKRGEHRYSEFPVYFKEKEVAS